MKWEWHTAECVRALGFGGERKGVEGDNRFFFFYFCVRRHLLRSGACISYCSFNVNRNIWLKPSWSTSTCKVSRTHLRLPLPLLQVDVGERTPVTSNQMIRLTSIITLEQYDSDSSRAESIPSPRWQFVRTRKRLVFFVWPSTHCGVAANAIKISTFLSDWI